MKTIRLGVFETNSSSAHVMTYTPKEKWEKFVAGDPNLIWVRYNPIETHTPYDKTDNILDVKEYAKCLCEKDPDTIGKLPVDFVATFIRFWVNSGNSGINPIEELLYQLRDGDQVNTYQDMKDLTDDFTSTGDYDWEKSEVREVTEGDKTFVKACAAWFDG
jgi:hypothetical protein